MTMPDNDRIGPMQIRPMQTGPALTGPALTGPALTQPGRVPVADTIGGRGERATLKRIFPRLPASDAQLLGPGDDAAVMAAPDGRYVVTTDMMVHGPDFRWAWSSPNDIGWKAAATNLSDVAAMGARPTALVVAIAAPRNTPVSHLEGIADGLREACRALAPGCGVVGGDLSASDTFTIAVTAFGDLQGRTPVLRSGARPGDVVAIAGALGDAGRGLRLLFEHAVDGDGHPDAGLATGIRAAHRALVDAQLRPVPPIAAGCVAAVGGATAMLDISDGLALDARRVAEASGVVLDLDAVLLGDDPRAALDGGEDHGLLACFPAGVALPDGFRRIGRVRAAGQGAGVGTVNLAAAGQTSAPTSAPTSDPDPVAGDAASGLLVDGRPWHPDSGWDPYRNWDGRVDSRP